MGSPVNAVGLQDSFGRSMGDLRISVTDRCNFRCLYCLPDTEEASNFYRHQQEDAGSKTAKRLIRYPWKPKKDILTFEEIERFTRIAAGLGIEKIRITGGEPLLRSGIADLISNIRAIPGIKDVALTSNGFLFRKHAQQLKDAGLSRMTFSLDSLDADNFEKMTGRKGLQDVLDSIDLAKQLGFDPVKVNAVIIRNLNDHELEDLVQFGKNRQISMRFIEYMPLDHAKAWQKTMVITGREMIDRIQSSFDIEQVPPSNPSETAKRWKHKDGQGEVGIIASVSEPFCQQCNRLRLTADGQLRTCLFSHHEHDFKAHLRAGSTDQAIIDQLKTVVWGKESGHKIGHKDFVQPDRTMSFIGG
ncbi:MAG: GTP 3',8-cyclase MoaA [Verrucomicrobiota bacterium]|nr:GTP 3',8-cyclase MoaA [Verrucomicrobiota bacterium]